MRKLALTFALLATTAAHAATDSAADKVLRQLDASSTKFQSAEANLKWDFFEKVVHDTTTQTGSIYFVRKNGAVETGAIITSPSQKYLRFANGKGNLYDVATKKDTPFDAGANQTRVESFLALGFGGSGKDIEKSYNVTLQGNETIDGVATAKLDLVPKDASLLQSFTHITMWIDPTRDLPLKQVIYTPEGDTRTTYYTNLKYNQPIDMKKYQAPKR